MGPVTIAILSVLAVAVGGVVGHQTVEVNAPTGRIRGSIINSRLGRRIYSFRGIRYAEPPTGERRFQVPTPARDWSDVFDATEEGVACPQVNKDIPASLQSEDCLRLNVYTTKLPSKGVKGTGAVKRPVLVFFHPGGFYIYSGQSLYFGPEYLLDKDIVMVTVNYRLATLGFISTGDDLAPGNLGMKDQVTALRWVRRNIAAFGGDPDSVTLGGESAGSYSLILHMVSPMSRGLFHRGIGMSAAPLSTEPIPTEQKHLATRQARLIGCPTEPTETMLECMRSKPVESFTNTTRMMFDWYGDPILQWQIVVEPEIPGVERFLTDQPIELIRRGQFQKIPLLMGITRDEFGGVVLGFDQLARQGNYTLYNIVNDNWETLAPISFLYQRGTPRSREISRELRNFYFGDQPINTSTIDGLAHIYADSVIIFNMHRVSKLIAENSDQPVYFYKFTFQGRYSYAMNGSVPYGVTHQDELQYLFHMKALFPFYSGNDPEVPMIERMTAIWSNFVKTGAPIPRDDPLIGNVVWDRLIPAKDNYLDLSLNPTMMCGLYPDRMAAWERIFPLPPLHSTD